MITEFNVRLSEFLYGPGCRIASESELLVYMCCHFHIFRRIAYENAHQILTIKGTANLRQDLLAALEDNDTTSFFEFEEDKMYSLRESELIQKYLQEHGEMLKTLEEWMEGKGYGRPSDFKGKMSQAKGSNPATYERVQFMKYFGGKKSKSL